MGRTTLRQATGSSATVDGPPVEPRGASFIAPLGGNFHRIVTMDDNVAIALAEKEQTNARSLLTLYKGVRPIVWLRVVNDRLPMGFGDRPDLGDAQYDDAVVGSPLSALAKPSPHR